MKRHHHRITENKNKRWILSCHKVFCIVCLYSFQVLNMTVLRFILFLPLWKLWHEAALTFFNWESLLQGICQTNVTDKNISYCIDNFLKIILKPTYSLHLSISDHRGSYCLAFEKVCSWDKGAAAFWPCTVGFSVISLRKIRNLHKC